MWKHYKSSISCSWETVDILYYGTYFRFKRMNGLNNWNPHSLFWGLELREANRYSFYRADLAQLAEQRIRNA